MRSNGRREDGISICIPNWNHRNYLPRSIGSALRAADDLHARGIACQVLVVDDFSRDGSQRLLHSLALQDARGVLDVVLAPVNNGLGPTRDAALEHAKFRFVCFMDADNELIPENLAAFWRTIVDTGAAFVYGNLLLVDESGATRLISNDILREDVYRENYIDAFALIDADAVQLLGGYYGKHAAAHEDWELLLHLVSENQMIVFVPLVLGYYHTSGLSMIKTVPYEHGKMHRIYSQRQTGFPAAFRSRRIYHPDLGWL